MLGSWLQNLQDNLNIDKQLIHNFAHSLYSKVNTSFKLIYPGIRSHSGCPQQDLFHKYLLRQKFQAETESFSARNSEIVLVTISLLSNHIVRPLCINYACSCMDK